MPHSIDKPVVETVTATDGTDERAARTDDPVRTKQIRELNDKFRTEISETGRAVFTQAIANLGWVDTQIILNRIILFGTDTPIHPNDVFTDNNDPHGEHDFGSFEHWSRESGFIRIFWKIDYYDENYQYGSENPMNEKETRRVLTIMRADEH